MPEMSPSSTRRPTCFSTLPPSSTHWITDEVLLKKNDCSARRFYPPTEWRETGKVCLGVSRNDGGPRTSRQRGRLSSRQLVFHLPSRHHKPKATFQSGSGFRRPSCGGKNLPVVLSRLFFQSWFKKVGNLTHRRQRGITS